MTRYNEHPLKIQSERLRVSVKIATIHTQMSAIHQTTTKPGCISRLRWRFWVGCKCHSL